ncbi:MAG: helix-turn-helix transcriptional regulator [Gemmataceae bacterium]
MTSKCLLGLGELDTDPLGVITSGRVNLFNGTGATNGNLRPFGQQEKTDDYLNLTVLLMVAILPDEKQDTTGFGDRLRVLREAAGLTQRELGEKVGIHHANLARLERGDRGPSWKTVLKLAEALGVATDDFRAEPPAKKPTRKPKG